MVDLLDEFLALLNGGDVAWQRDGACCEHREVEFFPERGETPEARELCRRCLVRVECAAYALERKIDDGVWGGTTGRQRARGRIRGLDAQALIAYVDQPRWRPTAPAPPSQRPPCPKCGGRVAKRDEGPCCWACVDAA